MQTTTLGRFTASRLCLGTMLMGGATPASEAHQMLDRFLDAGGTFIDTADVYGDGESERTLAPWLVGTAKESCSQQRCASPSPIQAARGSPRTGSGLPATRVCAASVWT